MFCFDYDTALAELQTLFADDHSGHDVWHTVRVYRTAMTIAERYACDRDVVALGALLHDADDPKLFSTADNQNARDILARLGVSPDTAQRVLAVIDTVSFSKGKTPTSLEGQIVQDADRLDAMGAIGIGRAFAYGGSAGRPMHVPGSPEDGAAAKSTIAHFYEKLLLLRDLLHTDAARELADHRHGVMEAFVEEFLLEWDGER